MDKERETALEEEAVSRTEPGARPGQPEEPRAAGRGEGPGAAGTGAEKPDGGAEAAGTGTGKPAGGAEAPGAGAGKPDGGAEAPGAGAEKPDGGAEAAGTGTGKPDGGEETSGAGAGEPSDGPQTGPGEAAGPEEAEAGGGTGGDPGKTESASGAETAGNGGNDGRRGFFGRKKKDPRDEQIAELTDRLRRNMAEFDNYRKRTEKEKSAMFEIGAKDIIERILPVIDNFERGLSSMPEDMKGTPFASGMEMIYKQLLKNLEDAGVRPIEALGQPFDPNFHNAVMHVEDENLGENVVAQELQKGYMYRDSVVRHSMVQVAN